ncbi:hypothetical protein TWF506_006601 [Arthrobotrys conoides]|uniref:Phthalate transporter n=1 Tax=Arthrobotrys conoides TaxID=74498 RepID=A0AAN8RYW3_9PEZI
MSFADEKKSDVYRNEAVEASDDVLEIIEYSEAEQKKIIHRIDRRLVIITGVIYCISIIDRSNIGSAAVAGMPKDLGMNTQNNAYAGYFPGASYLLSTWYNRYELGRRFAAFYVIGSIANAFTGIMAYGLMQMNGVGGLAGWRWIFIIEGLLTCVIAVLGYVFIPPFPDDPNAHKTWGFLNRSEVNYVIRKVEADRGDTQLEPFTLGRFFQGGKDWKCYAFGMMICMCTIPAYALAFFLPLILNKGMGYSVAKAQLMTAPPYLIQAVYQFAFGYVSDNYRARGPFIIFNCVLEIIGLAVMGWAPSNGARYFGVIMTCCGMAANLPLVFTYQSNNVRGQWKRAFSSTIMVSMAAVGGIIGSLVFRPQDAPSYRPGLYTCFTGAVLTLLLTSFFIIYFKRANKKADRGEKILEESESFRYTI